MPVFRTRHPVVDRFINRQTPDLPQVDLDKLGEAIEAFCLENLRNPRSREMEKMIERCKL